MALPGLRRTWKYGKILSQMWSSKTRPGDGVRFASRRRADGFGAQRNRFNSFDRGGAGGNVR